MSFSQERHGQIFARQHKAPENESPTALPTPELRWPVPGGVLIVPVLLVYSIGFELIIMYRSPQRQTYGLDTGLHADEQLKGLRVNGHAIELQSGRYDDYGFTYEAWYQLRPDESAKTEIGLDWPETERRVYSIPHIQEAARQAIQLWA
jgi:hypothetical protein